MRIGELSARTQVSVRMLRHYEQRGLLAPRRTANGYRDYSEEDVHRAALVASLIRSGLPTRLIGPLVGEGAQPDGQDTAEPALRELLTGELARLDSKIACLTMSRNTVAQYLQAG